MRHELIDYINSEEIIQDLNDETGFKIFKLSELLTESKTVFYFPDYLLQVSVLCDQTRSIHDLTTISDILIPYVLFMFPR